MFPSAAAPSGPPLLAAESSPASGELPLDPVEPLPPPEPLPASGDEPPDPPPLPAPLLDVAPPEPLPLPPELEPELEPPELEPPELPEGFHVLEESPQAESRGIVTTARAHRRVVRMFTPEDNGNLGASGRSDRTVLDFLRHARASRTCGRTTVRRLRNANIGRAGIAKPVL
jgi:hypothetical protein